MIRLRNRHRTPYPVTAVRQLVLGFAGLAVAMVAQAQGAETFHVSPACWDGPRIVHAGPPPAELANRVHLVETPAVGTPAGVPVAPPAGDGRLWVRNPDTSQPGPWDAALVAEQGGARRTILLVESTSGPLQPRWLNERLVFVRIPWGRTVFSDLIIDTRSGTLVYHELARDGRIAFEQFQAACRGSCPCNPQAAHSTERFSVDAAIPRAAPGAGAMIGLLRLPSIFGPPERGGMLPADNPRPVPVFVRPDAAPGPLAQLLRPDDVEHREYTYEAAAAVVYARRPGWYRIGLRRQALRQGWVREADAGNYLPIGDLLSSHLAYLNRHWDGHLWSRAGAGRRTAQVSSLIAGTAQHAAAEHPVRVLESRRVGPGLWLKVETTSGSPCSGQETPVVDRGWIPAYSARGELVAGYYSRGC